MSDPVVRSTADEEWEDLLRQWRAQPAAQPQPYFYSRVRARVVRAAATERPPVRTWLHWPAYAVMLGLLLLLSGDDAGLHSLSSVNRSSTNWLEAALGSK